jgi:hypothetical protein
MRTEGSSLATNPALGLSSREGEVGLAGSEGTLISLNDQNPRGSQTDSVG